MHNQEKPRQPSAILPCPNMVHHSNNSFSEFYHKHSNQCPYSKIKASRQQYRCKFILIGSSNELSPPSFVATSECNPKWIFEAITAKRATPVTENVQHVYEFMTPMGKTISEDWHKESLLYLASVASQSPNRNSEPKLKGIIFQCLLMLAQRTVRQLPLALSQRKTILQLWVKQYLLWCDTKPIDMETFVRLSLHTLDEMIFSCGYPKQLNAAFKN